jgi:hypothetical protein
MKKFCLVIIFSDIGFMARTQIGARLTDELVSAIDKLAAEQVRDRTNMIEFILVDWIREHRPELLKPEGE